MYSVFAFPVDMELVTLQQKVKTLPLMVGHRSHVLVCHQFHWPVKVFGVLLLAADVPTLPPQGCCKGSKFKSQYFTQPCNFAWCFTDVSKEG